MRKIDRQDEKGVALLLSILALLLLSAVAVTMMYMSSTESAINSNFKGEETQYFAARAGIEEARDRMIPGTAPYSINGLLVGPNPPCPADANCYLPTALPTAANGAVLYLLQSGVTTAQVFSPVIGGIPNPIYDDELCHDYAPYGNMVKVGVNVRCTTLPGGAGAPWYSIPGLGAGATVGAPGLAPNSPGVSAAPRWVNGAASNPLPWKWVRITLKANNSTPYPVDGNVNNGAKVCWNGTVEQALPAGFADCTALIPPLNPVYLVTSLSVSNTGTRRLIQTELAQKPPAIPPAGLWATGTGCPALSVVGGAITSSFTSANEVVPSNPPTTLVNQNGNVGANGGVSIQGTPTTINGTAMSASQGGCVPAGVTTSGNPTMLNPPVNNQTPYNQNPPSVPKNVPTGAYTPPKAPATWPAGTYGDVQITESTILPGGTPGNPAIYNVNSLSISGNNTITISGPVIFNIACGPAGNPCPGALAVSIGSNVNLNNSSFIPANFEIDYGVPANSAGTIQIKGNTDIFAVVNAPNAPVTLSGGSKFYGSVIGNTISVSGGTSFVWDRSLITPPPLTTPFTEITMRELSY